MPKFINMKKVLISVFMIASFAACKSNHSNEKETKKVDSVVTTTIKTDKEKADSVLEYYQKKIDSTANEVPEMPAQ